MLSFSVTNDSQRSTRKLGEYIFNINKLNTIRPLKYTYLINCLKLSISSNQASNIMFQITRVNSLKELLCSK